MGEELNELRNEYIEWSIESIRVQLVRAVLTDLVQGTECPLGRQGGKRGYNHLTLSSHPLPYTHTPPPPPPYLTYLTGGVVWVINEVTECGQQLWPSSQLPPHGYGGD